MSLILYSAVGGTDPISNFHDGSLLHICRVYKPNKVYILMSQEMIRFHEMDNRYLYCIEQLGKKLGHTFDVSVIKRDDLVNVNDFDVVYPAISQNIISIRKNMNTSDKLIVNIASGTPAMKYCLQFLSALADYDFTPISVATPERSMNPHKEDRNNYEPEFMWEINEDNEDDKFVNRCHETTSLPMLTEFYKHTLIKFINEYNYGAALSFLDTAKGFSDDVRKLLEASNQRLLFNIGSAQRTLQSYGFVLPYTDDRKYIFEYTLNLGIKIHKKDYADFIRAITPLMTELLLKILSVNCNINIDDYTSLNKKGIPEWDRYKLMNSNVESILTASFADFRYGIVYNSHLRELVRNSIPYSDLYNSISKLNTFEEKTRNPVAHTMIAVNPKDIKTETGLTPDEAYSEILKIFPKINISVPKNNSYDEMNKLIISKI